MTIQLLLRPSSSSSSHHCSFSASSQVRGRWRWAPLWLLLLATAFWCTTHWAAAVDIGGGGIGGGIDEAGSLPSRTASRRILRATPPRSTIENTLDQFCPEEHQCTDDADYACVTLYWELLYGTFCWHMPCVTSTFFISILQVIGFECGSCLDLMMVN